METALLKTVEANPARRDRIPGIPEASDGEPLRKAMRLTQQPAVPLNDVRCIGEQSSLLEDHPPPVGDEEKENRC